MIRPVLALALLGSLANAQPNVFEIYPDGTNTATTIHWRGNAVMFAPGELLQAYPERFLRGIGDQGTVWLGPSNCQIVGMTYEIRDTNAATPEMYSIIVRNGAGAPDCSAAGLIFALGPLTPPPGVGDTIWNLTTTFATVTVPCEQDWYIGLRIPQGGPPDGLLVGASQWYVGPGDNPWPAAASQSWELPTPCTPVNVPRNTWHYGVLVQAPAMNIGADHPGGPAPDPGYGMAGMWPRVGRPDGLCIRVRDLANAGGTANVYLSFPPVSAGFMPGLSLQPLLQGSLHLAGFTPLISGPIPASGEVTLCHPCFAPAGFCMAPSITWEFQAITFGVTPQPRLSNAQRALLQP